MAVYPIALLLILVAAYLVANRHEYSSPRCPTLLYHRFVSNPDDLARYPGTESIFTITRERFDQQMAFLKAEGYQSVTLQQVYEFVATGKPLPPRPVLITVDDGWTSNLDIMIPILRKHALCASFFVTTSPDAWIYRKFRGLDGPLSKTDVAKIHAEGFEIGSHSVTHPYLIEQTESEIRAEFVDSKRWIEEATGRPCHFLSIPGNFYDARIARIARESGYLAVFTANVGTVNAATGLFDIPRLIIEGNFTLPEFAGNLKPFAIGTRKVIAAVKKWPPHLLGATRYMALRERLFNSPLRALFIMRRLKMIALALVLLVLATLVFLFYR
jgi:peptidoglycan/xylan/chitin deacetylase (PgdA/CDA1 family)